MAWISTPEPPNCFWNSLPHAMLTKMGFGLRHRISPTRRHGAAAGDRRWCYLHHEHANWMPPESNLGSRAPSSPKTGIPAHRETDHLAGFLLSTHGRLLRSPSLSAFSKLSYSALSISSSVRTASSLFKFTVLISQSLIPSTNHTFPLSISTSPTSASLFPVSNLINTPASTPLRHNIPSTTPPSLGLEYHRTSIKTKQ